MINKKKRDVAADGSIKYLFQAEDKNCFEAVYLFRNGAVSLCISSQIGCAMGCTHCATGSVGFIRNMTSDEIVQQVQKMLADKDNPQGYLDHIVFMGMGEPMLNFDNVKFAIETLKEQLSLEYENFTICTIGIIHSIDRLIEWNANVKLAISVHSAINEIRSKIVVYNNTCNLEMLKKELLKYCDTGRLVRLHYTVINGVNDSKHDAEKLLEFCKGLNCEIRLIPFNEYNGCIYKSPTREKVETFLSYINKVVPSQINGSSGVDVRGGCGQLYLVSLNDE